MDLINKIDKLINEQSPESSTELTFNNWWGKTTPQIYLSPQNEVRWSPSWEFPPGTIMTEEEVDDARLRGYIIIPWS